MRQRTSLRWIWALMRFLDWARAGLVNEPDEPTECLSDLRAAANDAIARPCLLLPARSPTPGRASRCAVCTRVLCVCVGACAWVCRASCVRHVQRAHPAVAAALLLPRRAVEPYGGTPERANGSGFLPEPVAFSTAGKVDTPQEFTGSSVRTGAETSVRTGSEDPVNFRL